MKYTITAFILYAIALVTLIIFTSIDNENNMAKDMETGLLFVAIEFIVLLSAIIFSVLACIKEEGLLSKIPLAIPIIFGLLILLGSLLSGFFM